MSLHAYCCAYMPDKCSSSKHYGELSASGIKKCEAFLELFLRRRTADAEELGVPLFLTEFGACSGSPTCIREMDKTLTIADSYGLSWTYYQFKGFDDYSTQYGQAANLGMYDEDGDLDESKFW